MMATRAYVFLFRAALLSAWLPAGDAHGYITKPALRGGNEGNSLNGYCPHCLGSVNLPMPVCGKTKFLEYEAGPFESLKAGEMFEVNIKITAHHKGHFVLRLCDQHISSNMVDDPESCLSEHVLRRARPEEVHADCQPNDPRGDCQPVDEANPGYWYLPPKVGSGTQYYSFHYWLPANITCEKCTLQWAWKTANSCTPHPDAYKCHFQNMAKLGWDVDSWCSGVCNYHGACPAVQGAPTPCGEEFANCADLTVANEGGHGQPSTQPDSQTDPEPEPQSEPEPEPEPETTLAPQVTPAPPAAPGATCIQNPDCSSNPWCKDTTYVEWCPLHRPDECPTPQCLVKGSDPEPEPEPEPETEPVTPAPATPAPTPASTPAPPATPAPTPASTPAPPATSAPTPASTPAPPASHMTCKATPGLNRGVTDAHCAKCETGYKWWPCNEAILCKCDGALVQTAGRMAKTRKHTFLARDQGMVQVTRQNLAEL